MIEKKIPYIKPYKGYNQYNNRRLHYISYQTQQQTIYHYIQRYPDYQRLFPFYCIISFQVGKRSGGGIIALIWRGKPQEKTPQNAIKYHGFLTKTENRTIYYYRNK